MRVLGKNLLKKDPKNSSINLTKKDESGAPVWNAVKLGQLLSTSQLQSVSQSLNGVLSVLKAAEQTADAAESLIGIIKQLESLVKDVIGTLLDSIIKILEAFLNNLGSTGIYFLDSLNPYIIDPEKEPSDDPAKQGIIDYINALNVSQKESYFEDTLSNLESEFGAFDEEKRKEYKEILKKYLSIKDKKTGKIKIIKTTSYSDFIQKIADAYINSDDKPNNFKVNRQIDEVLDNLTTQKISERKDFENLHGDSVLYPGAPQWGPGSISYSVLLAFNFIDLSKIAINVEEIGKDFTDFANFIDPKNTSDDWLEVKDSWDKALKKKNLNTETLATSKLSPPPSGDMKWMGKSIESIWPIAFKNIRKFLNESKTLLEKNGDSWSDFFETAIGYIRNRIKRIRRFIRLINSLIKLLIAIQNTSFNMLVIQSRDGVYDIYDQLLSATGFPGQEEDEKSVILGYVLAAGAPSPDLKDLLLNFPDVLKDLQKTIDTETGEIVDRYDTPRDGGEAGLKRLMSFFKKQK